MVDDLGSTIRLNEKQQAVLAWIVRGCPPGVYPEDEYSHRVAARALKNRGLVELSGHSKSWRAVATERGRRWPEATEEDARERARAEHAPLRITSDGEIKKDAKSTALTRAMQRMPREKRSPKKKLPVKKVNKQETYMRYKVTVTRVQVAEK